MSNIRPHDRLAALNTMRNRLLGGALIGAAGVSCAVAVHLRPEELNAPAWVAYAACASFVLAGAVVIVKELGLHRVHAWLGVALLAALGIPGAWVALGVGGGQCSVGLPFMDLANSEWLCRGALGLGAVILAALFFWAVANALRKQRVV